MFVDFVGVKHLYDLLAFQEIRNFFLGLLQAFVLYILKVPLKISEAQCAVVAVV